MTTHAPTQEQVRAAWDTLAAGFDEYMTPLTMQVGEEIVDRAGIQPGSRLLDVAAGSGAVALAAARVAAQVVATDIAPGMIEALRARANAAGLSNLDARVMDGMALEFPDDTFDVSASLNGVSVFPDLAGGLAELVRVTRPGGRVVVGAFGAFPRAELIAFFVGAIQATVPGFTPPPGSLPPFRLADPEVFGQQLAAAGLTGCAVETIRWDTPFESATHLWNVVTSSHPIGAKLVADLTPQQAEQVRQVLDGMLRERSGGGPGAVLHADINLGIGTK
jgi:ubiquinone/menaquinone biosynthesis C-methylase UbiE